MKYINFFLLFIVLFAFYFFINSNLLFKINSLFLESLIFAIVTEILIFRPSLRLIFILISFLLFIVMIVIFVFSSVEALMEGTLASSSITANHILVIQANFFGSLSFGIFIISLVFYLPQIVKNGYIDKL